MATEIRHAAWQTGGSFAVKLLVEQRPPEDLASGLTEYLDAVDFAIEWLDREDPARDGPIQLAIVETRDGVTEEVWTYPPPPPGGGAELVKLFGFDLVNWEPAGRGPPAGERRTRLSQRVPPAPPRTVEHVAKATTPKEPLPPGPDASPDDVHAPARPSVRTLIAATARAVWDDPVSRCLLFLGIASLWLALGLADPAFLVLLLVSLPCLWWRQRRESAARAEDDADDWL